MGLSGLSQLRGVDLVKYFMAIGVITIHVGAMYDGDSTFPDVVVWWMRSAVPFFFITTGYLLARKNDTEPTDRHYFLQKAIHTYRIFLYWLIIYLPISTAIYCQSDFTIAKSLKSYFIGILTYGQCPGAPLWYIYALGAFMLTMYVAIRFKIRMPWIIVWFITIYFLNYCMEENVIVSENPMLKWFYLLTRRTFGGGIYILAGIWLYIRRKTVTKWWYILTCTLCSVFLFAYTLPLWELLSGVAFFAIALKPVLEESNVWIYLRQQSMWIYYTHMIPIFGITQFDRCTGSVLTPYLALVTAIFATLVLTNVVQNQQKRHLWLSKLIK